MAKKKTSKIRQSAKGETCTVRLGNCASDDTVVLAHIGSDSGMGMKCADYMGVYACMNCHDIIDGRAQQKYFRGDLSADILRAHEETLGKLFAKGLLVCA